jgi:hypothetical protein
LGGFGLIRHSLKSWTVNFLLVVALALAGLFADGTSSSARADNYMGVALNCGTNCTNQDSIQATWVDRLDLERFNAFNTRYSVASLLDLFRYYPATDLCYDLYVDDPTALRYLTNRIEDNVCIARAELQLSGYDAHKNYIPDNEFVRPANVVAPFIRLSPGAHTISIRRLWHPAVILSPASQDVTTYSFTVRRAQTPTTTTLDSGFQGGNTFNVLATITGASDNPTAITGTVTYTADGATVCTLPVGAVCAMNLAVGTRALQATYSGNATHFGSASAVLSQPVGGDPQLIATNGATQSAAINTAFGVPLEARIIDGFGNPVKRASVFFTSNAPGAGATFSPSEAISDDFGFAHTNATANATSGSYLVTAAIPYVGSATFSLSNYATPASITVTGGNAQSADLFTNFAQALQMKVRDGSGVPVPNATITFSGPASGATAILDSITATTDAGGNASVPAVANNIPGSYILTASVAGVATPASFSLSNMRGLRDPATLEIVSGNNQRQNINVDFALPLKVRVRNSAGDAIENYSVNFITTAGASAILNQHQSLTDVGGIATVSATANGLVGFYHLSASVGGVASPVSFDETNLGPPYGIAVGLSWCALRG